MSERVILHHNHVCDHTDLTERPGPGLHYVDRFGLMGYALHGESMPFVPRPERDILIALLKYALEALKRQGDDEGR